MDVNIFEADDNVEEFQVKIVTSLTIDDLIRELKQGELLATDWLTVRKFDAEFRIIVQGRRTGVGKDQNRIIDMRDGPLIISPP